jgi:hypothetical protein
MVIPKIFVADFGLRRGLDNRHFVIVVSAKDGRKIGLRFHAAALKKLVGALTNLEHRMKTKPPRKPRKSPSGQTLH